PYRGVYGAFAAALTVGVVPLPTPVCPVTWSALRPIRVRLF
ncbi:MAG: hypothetical protein ACI9W2_002330, partial [Gammaproteobacteria bacterium]